MLRGTESLLFSCFPPFFYAIRVEYMEKCNRLAQRIRNAGYANSVACTENIGFLPERKLNQEQILRLASCAYLQEKAHNVIILGPT